MGRISSRSTLSRKARICDSTDPEAVRSAVAGLKPESSYYLLASKSGTTTETLSFAAYAYELNKQQLAASGSTQEVNFERLTCFLVWIVKRDTSLSLLSQS